MTDRPLLELTEADAEAVIAALVAAGLGLPAVEAVSLPVDGELGQLGVDSLELIALASSVSSFFRLHESETEDLLLRRRTVRDWAAVVLASWPTTSQRLSFRSGGTTGAPTEHTHPFVALAQEATVLSAVLQPGRRRVVGLVPRHHIYGFLFTVLLPRALGVPFLDARDQVPSHLARVLRPGDVVVGFPGRWSEQALAGSELPAGVTGTTSTAPCPAEVAAVLRTLGLARLVEVYGSSETSGIGWRDDPTCAFQIFPWWSLADGQLVRAGRPVATPDILAVAPDGVRVLGRRDGAVQVGGVNVAPGAVAELRRTHPAVQDCAVRLMRPSEGHRLKAFVVLRDGPDIPAVTGRELRRWLAQRLPAPSRPTAVTIGTALPRDPLGKLTDW